VDSQMIDFVLSEGDRVRLGRLVEYFAGGDRSAYLRATITVMESRHRAERLRGLQAAKQRRLGEQGISANELPELVDTACAVPRS